MKKLLILLLGLILIVGCAEKDGNENGDNVTPSEVPTSELKFENVGELKTDWENTYRVMAHALGGIDNYDYTNSYEALVENYNEGTRLFEIDLEKSSDGDIVLTHTWADFRTKYTDIGGDEYSPLSTEEFKNAKIYGKYTPLTFKELLEIMNEVPDFTVIVDSKTFDVDSTNTMYQDMVNEINEINPDLVKRFVPQAYTPDIYDTLDQNFDFDKIIFTLYHYYVDSDGEKIYQFVNDRKVPVVVMHMDNEWATKVITDIYSYASMQGNQDKFKIYIHTVNDMNKANQIINDYHFFGVYSDFITEKDFQ